MRHTARKEEYDLSAASMLGSRNVPDSGFPEHVVVTDELYGSADRILTPQFNCALVRGRPAYQTDFVDMLAQKAIDIEVPFGREEELSDQVRELVNHADSASGRDFSADILQLEREIREVSREVERVSHPKGITLYTTPNRPRQFHDDRGTVIALRTIFGPTTELVSNKDVTAGRHCKVFVKPEAPSYAVSTDELIIFRGGCREPGFSEGLIHRAPSRSEIGRVAIAVFGTLNQALLVSR